jgi:tRNA G18 (ribose-2'-O)-methylase SpoU
MPLSAPLRESPETVRKTLAPLRNDFSVALLSAGNAFAVGAVIRVAHSFLAREVFVIGEDGWYPKASMGMEKYENVLQVPDLAAFREAVSGRPVWAVEKDYARCAVTAVDNFPAGVVFLFGSERFGMPAEVAAAADDVLGIPIYGVNHSLPLTVAAGIVMHEWARRRYTEGVAL